jgi:hypothetical protein
MRLTIGACSPLATDTACLRLALAIVSPLTGSIGYGTSAAVGFARSLSFRCRFLRPRVNRVWEARPMDALPLLFLGQFGLTGLKRFMTARSQHGRRGVASAPEDPGTG